MTERATLFLTDSRVILLKPKNSKYFTPNELRSAVNGPVEKIEPLDGHSILYANKHRMVLDLPKNMHSQTVANLKGAEYFTGNLLEVYKVVPGEERDDDRMEVSQLEA